MTLRLLLRWSFCAVALAFAATNLFAQCSLPGATHLTWPSTDPVWDFCFRLPSTSSGANGSGLELSEVRYHGTLVIARAHIPILNVKYTANPSGCGGQNLCYRDWFYTQQPFECAPTTSPWICTGTTTPATTVCQHPGSDAGSFNGVAVESLPDRLKLTAQCSAGWYRYIPVWEFFADGTIQARFVATSIDSTCIAYTHHHHAYFRFDVDVNTSGGNFVDQVLGDGSTQRVSSERSFSDTSPSRGKWRIGSPGSPYAVEITRNAGDGGAGDPLPIPDDFPVADAWVLAYNASEISDYSNTVSGCAANIDAWDNNENVNGADVVLWVRAAALHIGEPGGEAADCTTVGPTIRVLPASPPAAAFHTLPPCRIVDTRNSPGPYGGPALAAGDVRSFVLAGQCGVPPTAKSVAVNLTVTQPSSGGHITAFPAGGGAPSTSTVNFSAGQTRANNAVLPLGATGGISVSSVLSAGGAVHLIVDVNGYFE
ncbi:MAG TPA: hypothetical protein VF999_04165 [Thermoanaerobaculia bacterium]